QAKDGIRDDLVTGVQTCALPILLRGATPLPTALTPIYPTTAGLGQSELRRRIEGALSRVELDDTLPQEMSKRLGLCGFSEAVERSEERRGGERCGARS